MTEQELKALGPGDIIQHVSGGDPVLVQVNYGSYAIATRTHHVSNPREWVLLRKVETAKGR